MNRAYESELDFSSFTPEELRAYGEYVARLVASMLLMQEDAELAAYLRVLNERRGS